MAQALTDTVVITFEAKGEQGLIQAIKSLDRATKSMMETQASMEAFQKSGFKETEKGKAAYIRLKNTMKSYDKTLEDVTKDTKLLAQAQKGDTVAIMKLSRATKKYTRVLDRNKASIIGTTHDTRILGGSFAVLRSKMLLVSFGALLIERTFVGLAKSFARQEAVDQKLAVGLSNISDTTRGVTQRLIDYSSALQQTTAFGDELITNGMAQLTTFGLNEEAIRSLTPQVLNVARGIQTTSGSMPDLNSLFIAFGKATSTAVSALTRYGVVLTDTEKTQLTAMDANERAGAIAEILDRQYGGLAEAYSKTTMGMLEGAAAARGDAAEAFGEVLAPAVLSVSEALKEIAESLTVQNIKILGTAAAIAAGSVGILATGVWIASGGLAALSLTLITAAASMATFTATVVTSTAGLWAIGIAVGLAATAALKYFGVFDTGTKVLTDAQKRAKELVEAIDELKDKAEEAANALIETQNKGAASLQKQLDLLNATSEAQKMLINLGHEASIEEYLLIAAIVLKNTALAEQESKLKAVAQADKARAKAMKAVRAEADRLKEANRNIIEAELNKTITRQRKNLEAIVLQLRNTIKYTALSADEMITYVEALNNVSQALGNLGNKGEDAIEKLTPKEAIDLFLNQASGATSAYSSFVQGTVTADINALKAMDKYKNSSMEQRQIMEEKIRSKHQKALKRAALLEKTQAIASATIGTYNAVVSALGSRPFTPGNIALATIISGLGLAQVTSIAATPTAYAKGGDFVTNRPELIMVGEAGREHVKITPIDRPESRALGESGLTINFNNSIMSEDFTRDQIIPQIQQAMRMNLA